MSSFDEADKKLNRIYRNIFKIYKKDSALLEKVQQAQRQWIKYRDDHMISLFPDKNYNIKR